MANIQYDYSTLSTSMSHGEFTSSAGCYYIDGSYIINEENSDEKSTSSEGNSPLPVPPKDRFRFIYIMFGLLGLVNLLPYNFFITANDYWMYKLRDTINETSIHPMHYTPLQAAFTSYLTLASNGAFVIFILLGSKYSQNFPQLHRTVGSMLIMISTFIVVTALVDINADRWQTSFFGVTMILVVFLGSSTAILQSASMGIASLFPPKYMHMMMTGQAVAGIVATVAQIGSLLGHCSPLKSAFAYFMTANAFLIITLVVYLFAQKSIFFHFYINYSESTTPLKDVSAVSPKVNVPLLVITKKILPHCLTSLVNLWITLSLFPGITVLIQPESPEMDIWTGRLFLPLTCFLLFNISDFCGRIIGGWITFPPQYGYRLLLMCLLRFIFIPLFMFCNVQPRHFLVIFNSDIYYIAFITLLGLTNGIFMIIPLTCGPKCLTPDLQESGGFILSAFIGIGLLLGSSTSYILVLILQ